MRHANGNRKLSRATDQRLAMLSSIVSSLIKRGKIKVTLTRAKEARKMADRAITLAKYNDLHSRRMALALLRDKEAVTLLFNEAPKRFEGRPGGYTRMTRIGSRRGDNAPIVLLELV
jgi:large subunit ribosomal protein L17